MVDVHTNVKARLKDTSRTLHDLAPLYKVIVEYHKSLENTKRLGEQVAQKFIEIGTAKVGLEWGLQYVTIGEVQHILNKSMESWITTMRDICTNHVHKAYERDKEDLHAFAKNARSSMSSLDFSMEGITSENPRNSTSSQTIVANIETKKNNLLAEIDMFENDKCAALANQWVEVMSLQPFIANTAIKDKFKFTKRTSRSVQINPNPSCPGYPHLFDRSQSFASIPAPTPLSGSPPDSPPLTKPLSYTASQSSLPLYPGPSSLPLPQSSSIYKHSSFKNIFGKFVHKSASVPPMKIDIERMTVSPANCSTENNNNINYANAAESFGIKIKGISGSIKKRRHTIMTPNNPMISTIDLTLPSCEDPVMYPPKRNFGFEDNNLVTTQQ